MIAGNDLRVWQRVQLHFCMVVAVIVCLFPLYIAVTNSLKTQAEVGLNPLSLPFRPRFENYVVANAKANYVQAYGNSAVVALITVVLICATAGPAAYAMTKLRLPKADWFVVLFLLLYSLPSFAYLIPLFFLWNRLRLVNSLLGLSIIYSAHYLPFAVLLLRSYFIGLPEALTDAARVDGASEWQIFWRIVAPLSKPVIFTLVLILVLWTSKEFTFAVTFLRNPEVHTVALRYLSVTDEWGLDISLLYAGGVITTLPFILFYLALQRRFMSGMIQSGLTG